jgi:tripartite ATP-independent transporter DctM subunit
MGGLFLGWFTPTEAGAIGAFGVLAAALVGRNLTWKGFVNSLLDATRTTAMIMMLIAGSVVFGRFIAISRIPFELAGWTSNLNFHPFVIMLLIYVLYLILGLFMDAMALMLLTIPIFYPIAVDLLGYDPIWFGVVVVLCAVMGVITPPVGMNVYIIKGIAEDVPLEVIFGGIMPFLLAIIFCLILLLVFPQIVLYLPGLVE